MYLVEHGKRAIQVHQADRVIGKRLICRDDDRASAFGIGNRFDIEPRLTVTQILPAAWLFVCAEIFSIQADRFAQASWFKMPLDLGLPVQQQGCGSDNQKGFFGMLTSAILSLSQVMKESVCSVLPSPCSSALRMPGIPACQARTCQFSDANWWLCKADLTNEGVLLSKSPVLPRTAGLKSTSQKLSWVIGK